MDEITRGSAGLGLTLLAERFLARSRSRRGGGCERGRGCGDAEDHRWVSPCGIIGMGGCSSMVIACSRLSLGPAHEES